MTSDGSNGYPVEFLNYRHNYRDSVVPSHGLELKVGIPVLLMHITVPDYPLVNYSGTLKGCYIH